MFKNEIYLKSIISGLSQLATEVEMNTCINFYDINILSEDFYAKLLNTVFDYNLVNLNVYKKTSLQ